MGLIQFIADGDRSEYVLEAKRDLEVQARVEKEAIRELERQAVMPVALPSPEEIVERVFDLEARINQDVAEGREHLRRLLKDGRIVLTPTAEGVYTARTAVFPLMLLKEKPPSRSPGTAVHSVGSGGRI